MRNDSRLPLQQLLLCGALVVTLSMGIRHGFGLWLQPIIMERGWSRESFSLAMAVQNLVWGAAGPIVGWWADRRGAFWVLWAGALLYGCGLLGMAMADTPTLFMLSTGVLVGLGQACSTYAVVYGVLGRHVDPAKRSWAMGITAAAGSFGQFLMVPVSSLLISHLGWQQALWVLASFALLLIPLAWGLRDDPQALRAEATARNILNPELKQTAGQALREALTHPSYLLLTGGYFVCGFQLAFIGVHLPSYLKDHQLDPTVATTALALIGLFNVVGTYVAGALGQKYRKTWILSGIYTLRSVVMIAFILTPLSPLSVGLFAAAMGALWLSTVPPTNAVVAQMLGVQHLSMLGALVFFSHQIGSFMGVWLGGRLYDLTGSYDVVWWLAVGLGLLAAALNLPVKENEAPAGRTLARA
ncbi:MAG: MFS transporter [Aquabacterium sp.]|uniref:MFS transporter n=1 Tax=Aquabacterium sp. TaxID=1872578 RepID=UPI00272073D6|nr:MFS transporter [Aquabacterium sp.]MDO9004611.1 MFS transporter [Aquabacterium sp.]